MILEIINPTAKGIAMSSNMRSIISMDKNNNLMRVTLQKIVIIHLLAQQKLMSIYTKGKTVLYMLCSTNNAPSKRFKLSNTTFKNNIYIVTT